MTHAVHQNEGHDSIADRTQPEEEDDMQGVEVMLSPLLQQSDSQQLEHYIDNGEDIYAADEAKQNGLSLVGMQPDVRESRPGTLPFTYRGFELPGPALGISSPTPMDHGNLLPLETSADTIPILSSNASTRSSLRSFRSLALRLSKAPNSTKSVTFDSMSIVTASSWSFGRATGYEMNDIPEEDEEKTACENRRLAEELIRGNGYFNVHGQRYYCNFPGCVDQSGNRYSCNRQADLKRHVDRVHGHPHIDCEYTRCERKGDNGFYRYDHYLEHLRAYHGEENLHSEFCKLHSRQNAID